MTVAANDETTTLLPITCVHTMVVAASHWLDTFLSNLLDISYDFLNYVSLLQLLIQAFIRHQDHLLKTEFGSV
jgi:hypothetical protein